MSVMEGIKPFVTVSQKGSVARYFDTEAEATDYAKERAEENWVTLAVAKVFRIVDAGGNVSEHKAEELPVMEAANG